MEEAGRLDAIQASPDPDVHEDEVGPELLVAGYELIPGREKTQDPIARALEEVADIQGDDILVFDYDYAGRRGI
jgi:hypothetical protein